MNASTPIRFDDVMIAMDVVDTLRHESHLVEAELSGDRRRAALVEKLRDIYRTQGLKVTDEILGRAVDEIESRRFVHEPLRPGLSRTLAAIYVRRNRYALRGVVGIAVLALGIGLPMVVANKVEESRRAAREAAAIALALDLKETLPRELAAAAGAAVLAARNLPDADGELASVGRLERDGNAAIAAADAAKARQAIASIVGIRADLDRRAAEIARRRDLERRAGELLALAASALSEASEAAKDSSATDAIDALAVDLRRSAKAGDVAAFTAARGKLAALTEEIRLPLVVRIVDRKGVKAGLWRTRNDDPQVRLHYLVVEAERPDGKAVEMAVRNAETGDVERVTTWAVRVPEEVYERVKNDKTSDGIINDRDVGLKPAGTLAIDWTVPMRGEAITKW